MDEHEAVDGTSLQPLPFDEDFERFKANFGKLRGSFDGQVANLKVGGKVLVRSVSNISFSASAFGTLYAKNNPADGLTVSAGIGIFQPKKKK